MAWFFTRRSGSNAPASMQSLARVESLESRQFLSGAMDVLDAPAGDEPMLAMVAAPSGTTTTAPNVVGKYRGNVAYQNQKIRVNLVISRQTADGKIKGSVSSPLLGSTKFSAKGTIKPNGKFTVNFGSDRIGVNGSIKGTRNADNGSLKGTFQVVVEQDPLPAPAFYQGTFSLKKIA